MATLFILSLLIFQTVSSSKIFVFERDVANDGWKVEHPLLGTFENLKRQDCARVCRKSSYCLSFYYNDWTKECITNAFRLKLGLVPMDAIGRPGFRLYRLQKKDMDYPSTCVEVKEHVRAVTDGEYWLYPKCATLDGNRVRVYCHGMNTSHPTEYISLNHSNDGNYPTLQNRWCRGERHTAREAGVTQFGKIRLHPATMTVVRTDYTFATWSGTRHPYGEAHDCYNNYYGSAPCGPVGTFHIDTRGTGLMVDPKLPWKGFSWRPYLKVTRSHNDSVVDLLCGGWCGGCVPDPTLQLHYNHNDRLDHDQALLSSLFPH